MITYKIIYQEYKTGKIKNCIMVAALQENALRNFRASRGATNVNVLNIEKLTNVCQY